MSNSANNANASSEQPELTHKQILVVIGALMLGMLLAALDQTIVSTALPTIVREFGGIQHLSWVVTAYMLAATVSTPLYGKLGDQLGRKYMFQAAVVIFLVGSVLAGASRSMTQLIVFRAIQGIGGGGLLITAQAMVADIVSPRGRGRYQGYFGAVFGASSILGPLIGGFFTDHLSWRGVFYVNIPLGLVALAVTYVSLPPPREKRRVRIDYFGALFISLSVASLILMTTWGGNTYPWKSPIILGLAAATALFAATFATIERRHPEPILPLSLFKIATFNIACGVVFIIGLGLFGVVSFLPLFLQVGSGANATSSGLLMVPLMLGMLSSSILSGRLISRTGRYKRFPILGTLLATLGIFCLSQMQASTPSGIVAAYLLITGAGLGFVMQVMVLITQNAVDRPNIGAATSTVTFFRSIGGSLGVALYGAIFNARLASELNTLRSIAFGTPNMEAPSIQEMGRQAGGAIENLPPTLRIEYAHAVVRALNTTFLWSVPVVALSFALVVFLRETPLRGRN